jgi:hypothetical protein
VRTVVNIKTKETKQGALQTKFIPLPFAPTRIWRERQNSSLCKKDIGKEIDDVGQKIQGWKRSRTLQK